MLFTTAQNSPLIYYFTLGLLVVIPILLWIIGIVNVRKENKDNKRVGYAFLKIAGGITAVVLCAFIYMWNAGVLTGPDFEDPNVMTTTTSAQTTTTTTTTAVAETTLEATTATE